MSKGSQCSWERGVSQVHPLVSRIFCKAIFFKQYRKSSLSYIGLHSKAIFTWPANKMNLASIYIHWGQLFLPPEPEPEMEKEWRPNISLHDCFIRMERGITGICTQPTLMTFSIGILGNRENQESRDNDGSVTSFPKIHLVL